MELDTKSNLKRPTDEKSDTQHHVKKSKKSFSAKEFRNQLKSGVKLTAFKYFLLQISENSTQDCILEYLEAKGNVDELIQSLEDPNIPPSIVCELINYVLLGISKNYPSYHGMAHKSCKYFLSTYLTLINKMIGLQSSKGERIIILKLLTTIVMFSYGLGKEILINVNFNIANLDLLLKCVEENRLVREAFICFITAYLVNGHYPTLHLLLEKRGMLTSIIQGLQYDSKTSVCMLLTAMKSYILENGLVSKTAKMKIFNTNVVKNLVNLYNWKGPSSLKLEQVDKCEVNECVHIFLLVLCTSHKSGVIFRDSSVGLNKKVQNNLICTVLESLEKPWEHSYASNLVIQICGACPDLVKFVWTRLKDSLQPSPSPKWLKTVDFAQQLLSKLQPKCLDPYKEHLNLHQLTQVITTLVAPLPILKTIVPEISTNSDQSIRFHLYSLLLSILEATVIYVEVAKSWLNVEQHKQLKIYLSNYVNKNFPDAPSILNDWNTKSEGSLMVNPLKYLEIIFNIFENYNNLSSNLMDTLNFSQSDLHDFLIKVDSSIEEDEINSLNNLKVKIIEFFVGVDPALFSVKSKFFHYFTSFLLQFYYKKSDSKALKVLKQIFRLTSIFDECSEAEVNIWINGIFNLEEYEDEVSVFLGKILKLTHDKAAEYLKFISELSSTEHNSFNNAKIIECLISSSSLHNQAMTKRTFSPLLIGLLEHLKSEKYKKNLVNYINFVIINLTYSQTDSYLLNKIITHFDDVLPANLITFVQCASSSNLELPELHVILQKMGKINVFHNFSCALSEDKIDKFLQENNTSHLTIYPDLKTDLLKMSIFYFSKLVESNDDLQNQYLKSCLEFTKTLMDDINLDIQYILCHPIIIKNFSILKLDKSNCYNCCTKFVISIVKEFNNMKILSENSAITCKILKMLYKVIEKPQKHLFLSDISEILKVFPFDFSTYIQIIEKMAATIQSNVSKCETEVFYKILVHSLEEFCISCKNGSELYSLSEDTFKTLLSYYVSLTNTQSIKASALSQSFLDYLLIFPHHITNVEDEHFSSILKLKECDKSDIDLMAFLFKKKTELIDCFIQCLELISNKAVTFSLLEVLVTKYKNEEHIHEDFKTKAEQIFKSVFNKIESSINKLLQKPHKANQHFTKHYESIGFLIDKYMSIDDIKTYTSKVHKFHSSEIFHTHFLYIMFKKDIQGSIDDKVVVQTILTFIHLQINLLKHESKPNERIDKISDLFVKYLDELREKKNLNLDDLTKSDAFKLFCKLCLKFGISNNGTYLNILKMIIDFVHENLTEDDAKLIFNMIFSHSEFLSLVLQNDSNNHKLAIMSLLLTLCDKWTCVMERSHVPILLASYGATLSRTDQTILHLLKLYETSKQQTDFYHFKPFLWGKAAANHYSIHADLQKALFRQPKMVDVLSILQGDWVSNTIKYSKMEDNLNTVEYVNYLDENIARHVYDLRFLLPLFGHLLSPESIVPTHRFVTSGALSLSILGLSSQHHDVRAASCHILARFYFHLEARQNRKDNLLWQRFVEAVCRGISSVDNLILNNFVTVYLAKSALILTQPNHVMYIPLCQYLTAKLVLDFKMIPELYTFIHSSDVNYKEHRNFIFEILKDGLKNENDFKIFTLSMAFKLFSELYSSSLCDVDTKLRILDILISMCEIPNGLKFLCQQFSFLENVALEMILLIKNTNQGNKKQMEVLQKLIKLLQKIVESFQTFKWENVLAYDILRIVLNSDIFRLLPDEVLQLIYRTVNVLIEHPQIMKNVDINELNRCNDKFCNYLIKYNCKYVNESDIVDKPNYVYFLRLLVLKYLESKNV